MCVKPTTVCGTPQPTVVALAEKAVPVTGTAPAETKSTLAKRPKSPPVEDVEPELNAYLAEWDNASSKIRRLDCEFQKFRYDPIFGVERRGDGTLALEHDRRARYRVVPAVLIPGGVSKKIDKVGIPYTLEAFAAECWHLTRLQLFKFDDQEHVYERMNLPPGDASYRFGVFQFTNETLDLLFLRTFVLGMPADRLKRRYKVKLLKETGDELWLQLLPRRAEDSVIQKAALILDRRTWLTKALKVWDPTGAETVHIFKNIKVNSEKGDDLSKASLESYQPVMSTAPPKTEDSK
jgi:hypothetical protein